MSAIPKIAFAGISSVLFGLATAGSLSAAPYSAANGQLENSTASIVVKAKYGQWINQGAPMYFENCWWQKQTRHVKRGVRKTRYLKKSCPGLAYGASSIRKPTVDLNRRKLR
jgi:hypothetical protein